VTVCCNVALFPACHCTEKYERNPALSCEVSEFMMGPCFVHDSMIPHVTCCDTDECKYRCFFL